MASDLEEPAAWQPDMEEPEWLQPGMLKDPSDESGSTGWHFADQRFGAFVFVVAGSAMFILFFAIFLREFYWRKYGVDLCPSYRGGNRRRETEQESSDRLMAEELQRRLNEEEREAERLSKRKERRTWYEIYIRDFTMTVTTGDLFYAHETNGTVHHDNVMTESSEEEDIVPVRKFTASSISDEEAEEIDEIERGLNADLICAPVACEPTEEDAHLFLRLPVKDDAGICRTVDASCSICFSDYEGGDKIVWSGLQCRHAFHDACILPWLSKGKKRCPICRHWFVPGARIEDQKKELEDRLRLEAEAAGSSETSDETDDSHSDSENQASTTSISTGEVDEPSTTAQEPMATEAPGLDIESGLGQDAEVDASAEVDHEKSSTNKDSFPRECVLGRLESTSEVESQDGTGMETS